MWGGCFRQRELEHSNVGCGWLTGIWAMRLSRWDIGMLSQVWLLVIPWTVAHQAPLSMGFPSKNTGVGCMSSSRGSPNPGIKPVSPALAGRFFITEPSGKPRWDVGLFKTPTLCSCLWRALHVWLSVITSGSRSFCYVGPTVSTLDPEWISGCVCLIVWKALPWTWSLEGALHLFQRVFFFLRLKNETYTDFHSAFLTLFIYSASK